MLEGVEILALCSINLCFVWLQLHELPRCVQVCDFSLSVSTLAGLTLPLCHRVWRLYLGEVTA